MDFALVIPGKKKKMAIMLTENFKHVSMGHLISWPEIPDLSSASGDRQQKHCGFFIIDN